MKDLKLEDLMPIKDGLINFVKEILALKNVKITREAASADQEAADEFPDTAERKSLRRKNIWLNRFLMQTKEPLF